MALIIIGQGTEVISGDLNDNFEYLDGRINDVGTSLTTVQSNLSTINTNLNNSINGVASDLSDLQSSVADDIGDVEEAVEGIISTNGLYVTTYVNGSSWYREYFSNSEKTTRVWLEQGGRIDSSYSRDETITFLKAFSDNNYTIVKNFGFSNSGGTAAYWVGLYATTATTATTRVHQGTLNIWYACGK